MIHENSKRIAIIGAGPAGLTAAYLLAKARQQVTVFEKSAEYVGGISRTETYKGFHFDIGGHRFFSKSKEVEDFWTEILGDDMLERPRSSRIYYNHQFFSYPLKVIEALKKLGLKETVLCILSYLKVKLFPLKHPENFEEWVTNQFGKRLFTIFFKTYTEKVWGISCSEISADWAAQRIKGLSLGQAIKNALFKPANPDKDKVIKTLIDTFRYPKKGPGMMWEVCAQKCEAMGVQILKDKEIKALHNEHEQWSVSTIHGEVFSGFNYVLSSAAIKDILPHVYPSFNQHAQHAIKALKYRDFITVVLIMQDKNKIADNWIYIHDPSVKVGRVQNFKSWSPYMVPDDSMACYGLEYFCFEGDGLWNSSNEQLAAMAIEEMEQIGLAKKEDILDTYVVRQKKAYPVYDHAYKANLEVIRQALESYKGLYLVGRNGMHKYNNQDHSMMTAMLCVKNILAGKELYDLWKVNQDAEYHEEGDGYDETKGRTIPKQSMS